MPLIKCPDCGSDVSDRAATCIKCGSPIAARSESLPTGPPLTTIQETSKRLKGQVIVAAVLFWGGLIFAISTAASGSPATPGTMMVSSLCFTVGLFWYVATRFRIWWHHK